jgi:hypothetical protein
MRAISPLNPWKTTFAACIFAATILFGEIAFAQAIRVAGNAGYGSADVNVEGVTLNESPGTFAVSVDYAVHSRLSFGAAHLRSMKNDESEMSSAISLTGLTAKYYPWAPVAQVGTDRLRVVRQSFSSRNLSPFIESAIGFAQSSLRAKSIEERGKGTAVGVYLGLNAGLEVPLNDRAGMVMEGGYYRSVVGTGTVQMIRATFGFYFFL